MVIADVMADSLARAEKTLKDEGARVYSVILDIRDRDNWSKAADADLPLDPDWRSFP